MKIDREYISGYFDSELKDFFKNKMMQSVGDLDAIENEDQRIGRIGFVVQELVESYGSWRRIKKYSKIVVLLFWIVPYVLLFWLYPFQDGYEKYSDYSVFPLTAGGLFVALLFVKGLLRIGDVEKSLVVLRAKIYANVEVLVEIAPKVNLDLADVNKILRRVGHRKLYKL